MRIVGKEVVVASRPKLVFALASLPNGQLGLYMWGQLERCYFLINMAPQFVTELHQYIVDAYPAAQAMNHCILTFATDGSKAIPPHHDKKYNRLSTHPTYETGSDILLLNIGASRKLMLSKSSAKSEESTELKLRAKNNFLKSFMFGSGDMILLPGKANGMIKHSIEVDMKISEPRISIVFRHVDLQTVNINTFEYTIAGKIHRGDSSWQTQPALPADLGAALLAETSDSKDRVQS
jgi:hypothetical protein